jgi:phospholipid/cholesterol/gamma-HCH transport system permease protein
MEASAPRAPRLRGELAGGPSLGAQVADGFLGPIRAALREAYAIGAFFGRTFIELSGVWRYTGEILRQVGILITGSALIMCFMTFMMGTVCGLESQYVLRGYGATMYSGVFTSYCGVREMVPYMWGYILAAKVGCGLAAELGSMRIQEEIDAMESIGLNPMRFLVATRLVAIWIVFPFVYALALGAEFLANYLVIVMQIREVSSGAWQFIHWEFSTPLDFVYSYIRMMVESTVIVILAMFYGFRATGGPVGVGKATAKSMILNLILLHVIGAAMTMLFWGLSPNAPVGG